MTSGAALVDADLNLDTPPGAVEFADRRGPPRSADVALALRFVADEPGAFEAVVVAHQGRVTRLAHRLLGWGGGADVEDVVQDVFFAALRHRRQFRRDASLSTWLTAITVNRCRTVQRRRRLFRLLRLQAAGAAASHASPASDAASADETSRRVRQAVAALPPRDREVVVLRYFEGLSASDIAGVVGLSTNAVDVRLHRARARLAERLGAWHREERS